MEKIGAKEAHRWLHVGVFHCRWLKPTDESRTRSNFYSFQKAGIGLYYMPQAVWNTAI
jgi:hypothetical protein